MFHIGTCPQCNKHELALPVVQIVRTANHLLNLYFNCPHCKMPSCATSIYVGDGDVSRLLNMNENIQAHKIEIVNMWPEVPAAQIPADVPQNVARALLQAETNYRQGGHEEAAAVMFRKALETTFKTLAPELNGTLASRIKQLASAGRITNDISEWATEIKNLGNDGAHEIEAIDRTELEALRGLTLMVLTYLFTLPEEVKQLRLKQAKRKETATQ
jgi:transcription elongation factor Elf1